MSLEDKLREAADSKTPIPMHHIKFYMWQLFNGLKGMHKNGVCHRDLKPENILLQAPEGFTRGATDPMKLTLKICDLGAAKVLDLSAKRMNTPYVVSRYYRSPELIMGSHLYNHSIDVWASGCILFELLTRTPMFPGDAEGL